MRTGILVMAYGSPNSLDEVRPYLDDIRGGRPISEALLDDLTMRYRTVGVPSPLLETTRKQAAGVAAALADLDVLVDVGMKHWVPLIAEGMRALLDRGARRIVGIAAAPHFSSISIGGYEHRARAALDRLAPEVPFTMIESWYAQPAFVELEARLLTEQTAMFDGARVFFTAHSLPERILADGDPYRDHLLHSAGLIAAAAGVRDWSFAFQSASATGEPWLGPDILAALDDYAREGGARAIVAPIGFVTDHLEILYDIDELAQQRAHDRGIELRRIRLPNDDALLADAMAAAVRAVIA